MIIVVYLFSITKIHFYAMAKVVIICGISTNFAEKIKNNQKIG